MKAKLKQTAGRALGHGRIQALDERVADLESQVEELQQQNLRLAELADLVQELLVPLASRDQARVDAALESFPKSL